jgi:hypothetical protein
MQWFKHEVAARSNPKIHAIEKKFGEAGYARAFKLLEIVAERGGKAGEFAPRIDLKSSYTGLDWLADELGISSEVAEVTLEFFASVQFISPKLWRRKIVEVPQMLENLDEWTQRRMRAKASRVTPEQLPSDSGKSREEKSRGREAKRVEAEVEATTTAAAAFLKRAKAEEWKSIGLLPTGSEKFQKTWESIYGESLANEKLTNVMERCILACQTTGTTVPKPFFDAKRRVERSEDDAEAESEMSKMAGIRGISESSMR